MYKVIAVTYMQRYNSCRLPSVEKCHLIVADNQDVNELFAVEFPLGEILSCLTLIEAEKANVAINDFISSVILGETSQEDESPVGFPLNKEVQLVENLGETNEDENSLKTLNPSTDE